jgi:hypothetical protein
MHRGQSDIKESICIYLTTAEYFKRIFRSMCGGGGYGSGGGCGGGGGGCAVGGGGGLVFQVSFTFVY